MGKVLRKREEKTIKNKKNKWEKRNKVGSALLKINMHAVIILAVLSWTIYWACRADFFKAGFWFDLLV